MNKRYSCANIIPSECIPYTGKTIKFLPIDKQPDCDSNINGIFDLIAIAIDELKKATDVSHLNKQCLVIPTGSDIKSVTQLSIDKICGLEASLNTLKTQINGASLGNEKITMDLDCLKPSAAPCEINTNTYTLISILNLFRSEICGIKQFLGI